MVFLIVLILLPILFGALLPAFKIKSRRFKLSLVFAVLTAEAALCILSAVYGDVYSEILKISGKLSFALMTDNVSHLFMLVISFGWLLTGVYSFIYMKHEEHEDRFYAFYLIAEGAMLGLCFAANLITMYLFFEMVTLTSMPLVLHSLKKEAVSAAMKYLYYSIAGAFLALFGIFVLAEYATDLTFVPGGTLDMTKLAGHETILLIGIFAAIVGFGAKAGMYPLHGWLPTAHPVAPAPASAVLSGLIAKAGVLAILRLIFFSTGTEFLKGTWVQYSLIGLALLTIFMGSMMAYREKVFKKRLAYSTVSQISYILLGLFIMTPAGVTGGLLHVVFHAAIKLALFMTAGSIIYNTGKTNVDEFTGIGKEMSITIWSFTLCSLALIGIPPASGFVSKWYLATAALDSSLSAVTWLAPAVLLISALLTAGYLLPITVKGFFPGKDFTYPAVKKEKDALMWIPIVILAALSLFFGIFSGGLTGFVSGIANIIA